MLRILFYCHNLFGLGHLARSQRIAEAALDRGGCECQIITGCRFLDQLRLDPRIGIQRLPPVQQDEAGRFIAVDPGMQEVLRHRAGLIEAFCRQWRPHAVVVDHLPLGLGGELLQLLTAARREQWPTRFIWGIPYSEGATAAGRPRNPQLREAYARYDHLIAYTEEAWDDVVGAYRSVGLPARTDYAGIVAARPLPALRDGVPRLVGLSGGGKAGAELLRQVLDATRGLEEARDLTLRFVAGPIGSASELSRVAGDRPIEVWPEASTERAIQDASVVVSRVGYNTAFTLVQSDLPVVLVPLQLEQGDQLQRAVRLARLPGVWLVDERQPDAKEALARAIREALRGPGSYSRTLPFRTDGAERASQLILLAAQEAQRAQA
jgi:predicted glycosyltransferase